ncbi:S8 family serine peptidase [Aerosakkonemataceae cyanobacterium BLCC-F50]|uniref:S8 family serine peptidase n=1 Tax=Floridaenema flaviceps BLCC-F50 TaxID=3153642 RepID=A0ABV4XTS9_9CYAN
MITMQDNIIFGDELANFLVSTTAQNTILGLQGTDTIVGSGAADFLYGNTDADILYGSQGDDVIFGGKANDLIFGGKGNDRISGDRDNDTIYGDRGADTLTGGPGADIFVIGPEKGGLSVSEADWIVDFALGEDSIQVIGGLTFEDLDIVTNGGNTVIQYKATGEFFAVVQGVELQIPTPSNLPDPEIIQNAPVVTIDPPISIPGMGTGTERPVTEDPGNTVEEALAIAGSSNGLIYREQVSQSDPDDFYDFSVGASSNLILSLNGLNHNADLFLFDSEGNVIQSSQSSGITDEFITQPLETGSYTIQVKAVDPETTDYALKTTLISNLPGITIDAPDGFTETQTFESSRSIRLEPYINNNGEFIQGFRNDPRFAGIDGTGFSTVILDSGIDLDHPFFGPDNDGNGISDRIVFSHDFADNDADASDGTGHGSNVSSIVASQDAFEKGMVPGANIIALKVGIGNSNKNSNAAIEEALLWVATNADRYNIASVNMSFGEGNYQTSLTSGYSDELLLLRLKNVIVTAATGNGFFTNGSVPGVSYPAADPNVLAVGATWDENVGQQNFVSGATDYSTGDFRITSFSQRDPNLTDIFAPGAFITGANANGGTVDMSGTSQASPHIAGIAVLAQQLAVQKMGRRLTFDEFRDAMIISGEPLNDGDDEDDNVTNTGANYAQVRVQGLGEYILYLASLENPAPPPPPPIPKTQYNFVYLYDGATGRSNESYSGYTYASPGTLTVGTLYDPRKTPNERGTNGAYFIVSEQPAPSEALLGQVFVEKYTGNFAGGSSNTAVPYYFSVGSPSGFNGIGSEIDYVRVVGQRITLDSFGGDYLAADLPNNKEPIGITL